MCSNDSDYPAYYRIARLLGITGWGDFLRWTFPDLRLVKTVRGLASLSYPLQGFSDLDVSLFLALRYRERNFCGSAIGIGLMCVLDALLIVRKFREQCDGEQATHGFDTLFFVWNQAARGFFSEYRVRYSAWSEDKITAFIKSVFLNVLSRMSEPVPRFVDNVVDVFAALKDPNTLLKSGPVSGVANDSVIWSQSWPWTLRAEFADQITYKLAALVCLRDVPAPLHNLGPLLASVRLVEPVVVQPVVVQLDVAQPDVVQPVVAQPDVVQPGLGPRLPAPLPALVAAFHLLSPMWQKALMQGRRKFPNGLIGPPFSDCHLRVSQMLKWAGEGGEVVFNPEDLHALLDDLAGGRNFGGNNNLRAMAAVDAVAFCRNAPGTLGSGDFPPAPPAVPSRNAFSVRTVTMTGGTNVDASWKFAKDDVRLFGGVQGSGGVPENSLVRAFPRAPQPSTLDERH